MRAERCSNCATAQRFMASGITAQPLPINRHSDVVLHQSDRVPLRGAFALAEAVWQR